MNTHTPIGPGPLFGSGQCCGECNKLGQYTCPGKLNGRAVGSWTANFIICALEDVDIAPASKLEALIQYQRDTPRYQIKVCGSQGQTA